MDILFTGSVKNVVLLAVLIFISRIARFCDVITFCYVDKQLFYTIGKKSWCENLVDDIIFYKILTIFCICAFKMLVLRLQARRNSLCKWWIGIIHTTVLVNFYLNALENINLFIPWDYFNIAKSVNAALQML